MKLTRTNLVLVALALAVSAVGARAYALSCETAQYTWTLEPVSVERLSGEADLAAEEARFLAPTRLSGGEELTGVPERVTLLVAKPETGEARVRLDFERPEEE